MFFPTYVLYFCIIKSQSEYLVRSPVQAALYSYSRQKNYEYFLLGMTVRPEACRNIQSPVMIELWMK